MKMTIDSFVAQLALSKSKTTVDAYKYDVAQFLEYVTNIRRLKSARSLTASYVIDYLGMRKLQGKSEASVCRYYMAIRAYMKHLRKTKVMECDIMEEIAAPKVTQKAPRIPTHDEIARILEQPDISTLSGLRDRAIMELLYSSGLRASEVCALQVHHVGPRSVTISCGKRGKTRTVPITDQAFTWITRYAEKRADTKSNATMFVTLMGKPLRRQLLSKFVKGYAKKAGVDSVKTHTIRHTCATHLMDGGADLRMVQELLGHSSISSTQRYTHLTSKHMEIKFDKCHPRACAKT
jgi:integrase/recombinase XerD